MKFYGQFNPPVDRFIFERYFPDPDIRGVFVECGAFDGLMDSSCKMFEEFMGWTGYNFEPVPSLFDLLEQNRPRARNLQMALSDQDGQVTFRHAVHPRHGAYFGNGSLDHAAQHLEELEQSGCSFETFNVTTTTWRNFIASEGVEFVDLFVLDVEGHELSVLEGMKGAAVMPHIMCVEFGHLGFGRVRKALHGLGYQYDIHSHGNAYFIRQDLLGLFALRRAGVEIETSEYLIGDASNGIGHRAEFLAGKLSEIREFVPPEMLTSAQISHSQLTGLPIPEGKFTQVALPALKSTRVGRGGHMLYLHIAASPGVEISFVLESWIGTEVEHSVSGSFELTLGQNIVSIEFQGPDLDVALTPVIFLAATPSDHASLLTHVQLRSS
jgi:FkbM family methyltransferase